MAVGPEVRHLLQLEARQLVVAEVAAGLLEGVPAGSTQALDLAVLQAGRNHRSQRARLQPEHTA